jgi:hypothetical protein
MDLGGNPVTEGTSGTVTVATGTVLPTHSGPFGPGTYICVDGQWVLLRPPDPWGNVYVETGPTTQTSGGLTAHLKLVGTFLDSRPLTATVQPSSSTPGAPVSYAITIR